MSQTHTLTPSKSIAVHVARLVRAAEELLAAGSSIGDFENTARRTLNSHGDNIREDERGAHWDASDELTSLRVRLDEARRVLKVALHALKNVDGPFLAHEGEQGIFLAQEHDCTCWDAEQEVRAFLEGASK